MVQAPFSFKNAVRKILRGRMLGMNGHSAHACAVIWGIYDFTQLIVLNDLLPVNSIYNFIKCVNITTRKVSAGHGHAMIGMVKMIL